MGDNKDATSDSTLFLTSPNGRPNGKYEVAPAAVSKRPFPKLPKRPNREGSIGGECALAGAAADPGLLNLQTGRVEGIYEAASAAAD